MSSPAQRRSAPARTGKQRTTEPPRLTRRQFDFEASISSTSATQLTLKQIRDHTYPQLTPVDAFRRRDRAQHTHARPFGDDFVELLVHRDGEHIRPLTDDHVAQVGATELFELARERLRLLPTNGCQLIRRDRSEFHVLRGDCVLTASKLLVLPDVVGPILGRARTRSAGVLVSVPSRRELVFADVNENIAANLVHLARYAMMTYEDCCDPLNPTTYWWRDGSFAPVVTYDRTGFVDFRLPPEFSDLARAAHEEVT